METRTLGHDFGSGARASLENEDRAARAPWIELLMGWTAGDDPAAYVEIDFPDLEAAINHARRLGVDYEVHMPPAKNGPSRPVPAGVR